jgi:hypothetical protein
MKPSFVISKMYNDYADVELAFYNKSISKITGLDPKRVSIKVKGEQWNCILYTCSMKSAKVILGMDKDAFENLRDAKNYVNLNLAFFRDQDKDPVSFFIPSIVESFKGFSDKHKDTFIFNLNFTQKPSDDLIEIISDIIEEKEKFEKRKNTRINVNNKIVQDIGLTSPNVIVEIDKIKRSSILRNISTTGASLLLSCIAKFLIDKSIILYLNYPALKSVIPIIGEIIWSNVVEGRKDINEIGIEFDVDNIPMEFKHLMNAFFDKLEAMSKQK